MDVTNTGKVAGKEVVQLYIRDIKSSVTRPEKELKAFNDHRMAIDLFNHLALPAANKDFLLLRSDRIAGYNYTADHTVSPDKPDSASHASASA